MKQKKDTPMQNRIHENCRAEKKQKKQREKQKLEKIVITVKQTT